MAASQIQIVNEAMTHLGCRLVGSMLENSEAARRANAKWPIARDAVLRDCPWNFATMIQPLALSAQDTVVGWNYVYVYPSKCLLVRKVFNLVVAALTGVAALPDFGQGYFERNRIQEDPDFREMLGPTTAGKILVSQLQSAYAEYTYLVDDVTLWDALFVRAMGFMLAAELAPHLVGDRQLKVDVKAEYASVLSEAKRVNFSEGDDKPKTGSTFVESR